MIKIACVGYHETGAGVIDNIFRECDNVCQGAYEAEVRFLHDPDGISDLEYHLVENPHRLSSALAIKRFIKYAKSQERQICKVYGKDWVEFATEFAESLALCKFKGYTNGDLLEISDFQRFLYYIKKGLNKLKPRKFRFPAWHNYFPQMITYYSLLEEDVFISKVKQFTERFAEKVNTKGLEYVVLDQFIGANNPSRYLRYVDNMKVIIVDRDPRDLFIHHSERKDKVLPNDAKQFCVVYKSIRKHFGEKSKDVMYIRFEDLVYNYEESVNKVLAFVGILPNHHVSPGVYFDPVASSRGTKLWERFPKYNEDIDYITKTLPEYLYNY